MTQLRWWIFQRLSAIGWRICPEPHRSRLQNVTPTWQGVNPEQFEKRILNAIFDPGSVAGARGDRNLSIWQAHAVMFVFRGAFGSSAFGISDSKEDA